MSRQSGVNVLCCYSMFLFFVSMLRSECFPLPERQLKFISDILDSIDGKISLSSDLIFKYRVPACFSCKIPNCEDFLVEDVVIWDPLRLLKGAELELKCPSCPTECPELLHPIRWKDGKKKHNMPRRLHGLHLDALLVSRVYICSRKHQILAHDPGIIEQTKDVLQEPFLLLHQVGFTRELYNFVVTHINAGMSIQDVQCLWHQTQFDTFLDKKMCFERQLLQLTKLNKLSERIASFPKFMAKGEKVGLKVITACFVWSYYSREDLFNYRMSQTTAAKWLCADHTFKVPANIGFWYKRKWIKMYDTLFIVLNEHGVVLAWQLCKGTKFEVVKDLLVKLHARLDKQGQAIEMFFVDNCCQWGDLLKTVFPAVSIKLDAFHGVQRIVKEIPKRKGNNAQMGMLRRQMIKNLKLIIRDPSDKGKERTMTTPCPDVMIKNIEEFIRQWKNVDCEGVPVLPKEALVAIDKLKVHIIKGCLSGIPVSGGTNRNENLHKTLNKALKKARVGIQLAVALLGTFFYRWNEKKGSAKLSSNNKKKIKVVASVENYCTENLKCGETFGTRSSENGVLGDNDVFENDEFSIEMNKLNNLLAEDYEYSSSNSGMDSDDSCQESLSDRLDNYLTEDVISKIVNRAKNLSNLSEHVQQLGKCELFQHHNMPHFTSALSLFSCYFEDEVEGTGLLQLDGILKTYNMCRLNVAPDGNCFFVSVAHGLQRLFFHNIVSQQVKEVILSKLCGCNVSDIGQTAAVLRRLTVEEWLRNEEIYNAFLITSDNNYQNEARLFLQDGFYTSQLGNAMPLAMSNILGIPIVVFTGMQNMPVIPICPTVELVGEDPVYLAFDHTHSGHYDAVYISSDSPDNDTDAESARYNSDKYGSDNNNQSTNDFLYTPSNTSGCRCGQGAKKKKKEFKSCYAYKTGCPCFGNVKGCSDSCNCINCDNKFGKKESSVNPVQTNTANSRKRRAHQISSEPLPGASFFEKREKTEPKINYWTMFEEVVLTELLQLMIKQTGEIDSTVIYAQYCSVVNTCCDKSLMGKCYLTEKTLVQITAKISKILTNDKCFQTLLKEQARLNYF